MAGVRLERLSKIFDDGSVAVRALDLEIRAGEFLVLLGPSGCGKTTTLRMIAGLEAPTEGRIWIGERDVTDVAPQDRDVAMVFQNYALYPHMSVFENLAFGLRMRNVPRPELERRVRATAASLGLDALLERRPAALSGGQRQRVALGRAIVREPRAFLFDEPLSNLDAKLRVNTRAELVRLHRQLGTTMIYVTHDQTEAMTMGQRIAVLHEGELQQVAAPLEIYDRPANLMVAGFVGSPAMNFFAGRRVERDGVRSFEGQSLIVPVAETGRRTGTQTGMGTDTQVILGIRPEHLAILPDDGADTATGSARAIVQVIEPLGSETLVVCRTAAGEDVTVRLTTRPELHPEQNVVLRLDTERMHLFDAARGTRLGPL